MKTAILTLAAITVLGLTSCEKKWGKGKCGCKDNKGVIKEYVYEPLVMDESCGCIVSGKVKYIGECGTIALLDYGDGTCDDIALKTLCQHGKCEGGKVVQILLDCDGIDPEPNPQLHGGPE